MARGDRQIGQLDELDRRCSTQELLVQIINRVAALANKQVPLHLANSSDLSIFSLRWWYYFILVATIRSSWLATIRPCSTTACRAVGLYYSIFGIIIRSLSIIIYSLAGHILRKVYNCRERKNFRPPNIEKCPVKKNFYAFSTVPVQNLQLQLHNSHFTTANYILQLHKLSSVAH